MLTLGERRIYRGHGKNQFCLSDVPANEKRRRGCRRLFAAADETGVRPFGVGLGLCVVAQGDACVSLSAILRVPVWRDLRSRKMNFSEAGLFRLLRGRRNRSRTPRARVATCRI